MWKGCQEEDFWGGSANPDHALKPLLMLLEGTTNAKQASNIAAFIDMPADSHGPGEVAKIEAKMESESPYEASCRVSSQRRGKYRH